LSNYEQEDLIAELRQAGIKHSPKKIVRIAKTLDGKIVFLETGDEKSGLQHILKDHALEFSEQGIQPNQIPDVIMTAVTQGQKVGLQGKTHRTPRSIYRFSFNNQFKYIAIQISDNGYIVSANPKSSFFL
jgi:hypothetical protein